MNKFYVTWEQFDALMGEMEAILDGSEYDHIIGLSRGGLPIAVKLSNLTGIPMTPITWQTRDGHIKDFKGLEAVDINYNKILVVDDICDSGQTFSEVKNFLPNATYYAMVTKKVGGQDFAGLFMEGDNRWVVFPWEKIEE